MPQSTIPFRQAFRRFSGVLACTLAALIAVTYSSLEFMQPSLNRRAVHFSLSVYFDYLLLMVFLSLPLALTLFALQRALATRHPGLWNVLLGLLVGHVLGTVVIYRAALGLAQLAGDDAVVSVLKHPWVFAYATAILLATVRPVRIIALRVARVGARLVAPLPFVMLVYFASLPQFESRQDPLPALRDHTAPATVLVLVCDALDRQALFENDSAHGKLPVLEHFRLNSTYFPHSKTPAFHTSEAMPSILYQRDGITREDYLAVTENAAPRWEEFPSLFDLLGRAGDVRVVSGYHVLYGAVLGGRDITIRTRALQYPKHRGLARRIERQLELAAHLDYMPGFTESLADMPHSMDNIHVVGHEIFDDTLECVRRAGPCLVGVFHLAWPHPPFQYDREGRVRDGGTYLKNAEYLDARLDDLFALLRERGLWDNSTIVITGDHGYPFGRRRQPPLMIKLPGQSAGRVVEAETYTSDIAAWLNLQPEFTRLRPPRN